MALKKHHGSSILFNMNFYSFVSAFNTAYNNKFRFLHFKKIKNLESILKLLVRRGLILGFFFYHENVIVSLKYIKDTPFFKIIAVSKPSKKIFFSVKKRINGKMSGSEFYVLSSAEKGYYFSDDFKNRNWSNKGGEVLMKILFFNDNNFSKKSSFI